MILSVKSVSVSVIKSEPGESLLNWNSLWICKCNRVIQFSRHCRIITVPWVLFYVLCSQLEMFPISWSDIIFIFTISIFTSCITCCWSYPVDEQIVPQFCNDGKHQALINRERIVTIGTATVSSTTKNSLFVHFSSEFPQATRLFFLNSERTLLQTNPAAQITNELISAYLAQAFSHEEFFSLSGLRSAQRNRIRFETRSGQETTRIAPLQPSLQAEAQARSLPYC